MENNSNQEIAIFGGGCFWCLEVIFKELQGVETVVSGYAEGNVANPSYEQVCSKTTGHAEVIKIIFNPSLISYRTLLEIFFFIHNPTTLNQQGADRGTQYRSVIFYNSSEQQKTAYQITEELNIKKIWKNDIVTEIKAFEEFFQAEDYHQNYYEDNLDDSYCHIIIEPKLAKFRHQYQHLLKEKL